MLEQRIILKNLFRFAAPIGNLLAVARLFRFGTTTHAAPQACSRHTPQKYSAPITIAVRDFSLRYIRGKQTVSSAANNACRLLKIVHVINS
jgi:hypothetical protein